VNLLSEQANGDRAFSFAIGLLRLGRVLAEVALAAAGCAALSSQREGFVPLFPRDC
jgi:hypothetical protein